MNEKEHQSDRSDISIQDKQEGNREVEFEQSRSQRNVRKKMIIAIAAVLAGMILLAVLVNVLEMASNNTPSYVTNWGTFKFSDEYITDESEFWADEGYVDILYDVRYYDPLTGVTVEVLREQFHEYGPCVVMLGEMIDVVMAGDAEGYNALFSEAYYKKNEPKKAFSMQKIYEITISKYSEETVTKDGITYNEYIYTLAYKIRNNNGSLHTNAGSDGLLTQYIVITNREGKLLIDGIYT